MFWEQFFGYAAALLTTIAYIPQTIKVYKSHRTKDISIGMFSTITLGILFWLIYGVIVESLPIIIANFITLIMAAYIFLMKVKLDYLNTKDKN